MNTKNLDIQLVLCPVREPEKKYVDLYHKIYSCWHEVWSETYAELKYHKRVEDDEMRSDAFTRQDFAAAFFHKDECVAVILFRHVDMSLLTTQQDSYFIQWSEIHRKAVVRLGHRALICGNLAVNPKFRKKKFDISLKDLMVGMVAKITVETTADVTIATPRRDRNVHGVSYNWGATPIAQDVDWGCGVSVDLVTFRRENILAKKNHELFLLMSQLWSEKLVVSEEQFESINFFKRNEVTRLKKLA